MGWEFKRTASHLAAKNSLLQQQVMTKVKKEISNRFGDKVCSAGHVTRRELSDFYSQKKERKKKEEKMWTQFLE